MKSKLILNILTSLVLCLLISLGVWQLHRAAEKRLLLNDFSAHAKMDYLKISDLDKTEKKLSALRYFPIKIKGYYDNFHTFLLDNKFYNHQLGYEVLTPFFTKKNNKAILVNRGWVPRNYQTLAILPKNTHEQTIHGIFYIPLSKPFILKETPILSQPNWPLIEQGLQFDRFENEFKQKIYPAIIWLDKKEENGFIRDWHPVFMSPQQHIAYAIQWFALALTLSIIYITLSKKQK